MNLTRFAFQGDYAHDDPNPTLIQRLSGDTAVVGPPHGHGPVSFLMIFFFDFPIFYLKWPWAHPPTSKFVLDVWIFLSFQYP